jgi:hypothetical protein
MAGVDQRPTDVYERLSCDLDDADVDHRLRDERQPGPGRVHQSGRSARTDAARLTVTLPSGTPTVTALGPNHGRAGTIVFIVGIGFGAVRTLVSPALAAIVAGASGRAPKVGVAYTDVDQFGVWRWRS